MEGVNPLNRPAHATDAHTGPRPSPSVETAAALSPHRIEAEAEQGDCCDRACDQGWRGIARAVVRHRTLSVAAAATLVALPVAVTGLVFFAKGDVPVGLGLTIPAAGIVSIVWCTLCCFCNCAYVKENPRRWRYVRV